MDEGKWSDTFTFDRILFFRISFMTLSFPPQVVNFTKIGLFFPGIGLPIRWTVSISINAVWFSTYFNGLFRLQETIQWQKQRKEQSLVTISKGKISLVEVFVEVAELYQLGKPKCKSSLFYILFIFAYRSKRKQKNCEKQKKICRFKK